MAEKLVPYFYDGQIRRFMLQVARIFSNWQVEFGRDEAGDPILYRVPCMYGNSSRQAADIIAKNTQNNLPTAPLITFYITQVAYARDRIQDPTYSGKISVRQRTYDDLTGTYETTQGNAFTVERLMPVPCDITINVDFWTTNEQQKQSLFEQIFPLFNPALEIQSTDNFIDWTSLTTLEQTGINWTTRTVPVGGGNPIDITTITYKLPIWISVPAKVTKYNVIHQIIANIFDGNGDLSLAIDGEDILNGTRQVITPMGYQVLYINGQLQCLRRNIPHQPANSSLDPDVLLEGDVKNASNLLWHDVIAPYGALRNGISQIALSHPDMGTELIGTVSYNPMDDRVLSFVPDPDTFPPNTLQPVNAVINPQRSGPGSGLPAARAGQRYLLTDNTGSVGASADAAAPAWTSNGFALVADADDIIEYDGVKWFVAFDASAEHIVPEFVTNLTTMVQYRYIYTDGWAKSVEGYYAGGEWRLII